MKVLSLLQPWASLVAHGAKHIETRSWRTDHRGPLAIHASKRCDGLGDICETEPFKSVLRSIIPGRPEASIPLSLLPRGYIIAVVDLLDVIPTERAQPHPCVCYHPGPVPGKPFLTINRQEREFGDYSDGRWAWVFDNVRLLSKPIPAKGSLNLWEYPLDLSVLQECAA